MPASAAGLKVGVVDLQKIMHDAPRVKAVKTKLKKEFAPQQQALAAKQADLHKLEDKLSNNNGGANQEKRQALQMKAATLRHDIQQMRNDFVDDLNLRRNQELGKLQQHVLREINSYADEHGFDLVIGSGVFYASQRVNITNEIIEKLNRKFKQGGGKAASGKQ